MNEVIYLKFNAPNSRPKQLIDGPVKKVIKNALIKILTSIIPEANPDFEKLIGKVDFWKIEFNKEENVTYREIGFDRNGKLIVAMPLAANYGYWTDNSLVLGDYEKFGSTLIEKNEFEHDGRNLQKTGNNPLEVVLRVSEALYVLSDRQSLIGVY